MEATLKQDIEYNLKNFVREVNPGFKVNANELKSITTLIRACPGGRISEYGGDTLYVNIDTNILKLHNIKSFTEFTLNDYMKWTREYLDILKKGGK